MYFRQYATIFIVIAAANQNVHSAPTDFNDVTTAVSYDVTTAVSYDVTTAVSYEVTTAGPSKEEYNNAIKKIMEGKIRKIVLRLFSLFSSSTLALFLVANVES